MVRIHMCDQSRAEILACLKFSAKLAGLPRFMTDKQLEEIGKMVDAIAWVFPKAQLNYQNLQHTFFYFANADDFEAAISNDNLTINGKH
ncbi:20280_t:CDS:1, partial [Funneliformis geosporum]